jgi:AraC family transcriptional regulator
MLGKHSFGEELRACELNGIRVSETLMPAELALEGHAHESAQLCFVLEGTYRETTRGGERLLRPGALQLREPGEWHSNVFSESGALTLLLSFPLCRWRHIRRSRPLSSSMLWGIATDIRDELSRIDEESSLAVEGLSLLLLSRLSREAGRLEPAWLGEAVFIVESSYSTPLSLTTLANRVGVHRATLSAAFRRFRDQSVGEFIRDVRLRRATDELLTSSTPLSEIAVKCGFSDQAHFTRLFRRQHGRSPGALRRTSGR